MTGLLLHEIGHILIYYIFLLPVYYFSKAKKYIFKFMLPGLFITMLMDADHFIDYFLQNGFDFKLYKFLKGAYFMESGKIYVLAHAWEYVIITLVAAYFIKNKFCKWFLVVTAIAMGAHLFWDTYYYGFNWNFYFITWRLSRGFVVF